MNRPLRIGMLGMGQRGLQHLNALSQLQQKDLVQIVALGDAFSDNLALEKLVQYAPALQTEGLALTTDFNILLTQNLDGLYVCIPPNVHNGEVVLAAQKGIHLFVEKPMSLFMDQALEMETAIEQAGVISAVGFQQRFDVRHEAVRHFLHQSYESGSKQPIMATYTIHAPFEGHNVKHTHVEALQDKTDGPANRVWTANAAWSGMTVVEGGIHPLDLWRYWFGNVTWVQATYVHRPPTEVIDGADNPYSYAVHFGFENGAVGVMTISRLRRVFHTYLDHQILWHEGRLVIEPDGVTSYHYAGEYPPAKQPSLETVRTSLALPPAVDTTLAIGHNFVQAIRENNPQLVRSSFSDAMNSLAAVLAANASDQQAGARIQI